MSSPSSLRRALVAAALATATAGSLLVPAAPASAAVVDGHVGAYGWYLELNGADDCTYDQSDDGDATRVFSSATGRRTARSATGFRATPTGGEVVSAHGRVGTTTSGVTDASDGAFDKVKFTASHFVRITDDTASDCGMRLVAQSLGGVDFRARRGGRTHLAWDRGATGTFEWISVRKDGGRVVERIKPKAAHGEVTFRLRRGGHYTISVHFRLRASERAVPVGETLTKRTYFRVVADFQG